jgi:hypothetical protein
MQGFIGNNRTYIVRDPDNTEDYVIDLTDRLAGREVSSVTVVKSTGVTVQSAETNPVPIEVPEHPRILAANSAVIFWLAGGVTGVDGQITLRVTTTVGSQFDLSYSVYMKQE